MKIVKHKPTLKAIANRYKLSFCEIHKYYEGDAYKNNEGENIPYYLTNGKGRVFKLKYFDGCFNPFLVELTGKFWYNKETNEPVFKYEPHLTPLHLDKIYCK